MFHDFIFKLLEVIYWIYLAPTVYGGEVKNMKLGKITNFHVVWTQGTGGI